MNPILLKLAQETDVWCDQNHAGDEFYAIRWEEHFAELIVRECAGLFPNVYVEIKTDYGHTPVIAADYIKQHFGVEE